MRQSSPVPRWYVFPSIRRNHFCSRFKASASRSTRGRNWSCWIIPIIPRGHWPQKSFSRRLSPWPGASISWLSMILHIQELPSTAMLRRASWKYPVPRMSVWSLVPFQNPITWLVGVSDIVLEIHILSKDLPRSRGIMITESFRRFRWPVLSPCGIARRV